MKCIFLPTAILLAATLTASAQDASPTRDGSRIIRRVEHRLSVTASQREQIKAILQQERPTLQQLHTQLAAEHAEMAQRTAFDEGTARAIAAKYANANTAAVVERERLRSEFLAILTPEQQKKLQQFRARFGAALDERLATLGDTL